jgi:MerR family transcriptional regulator, light-induced transcriptional regulator
MMFGPSSIPSAPDVLDQRGTRWTASPMRGEPHPQMTSERTVDRTIETELVPRMLMAHQTAPAAPLPVTNGTRTLTPDDIPDFLQEVLGTDDAAAAAYVRQLLADGVSVESIYLDLLSPSARELGLRWEDDECSFVDVTVAMGRLQRVLRELSQVFQSEGSEPAKEGQVLLTCLPGEQHTLGLIMVAEFLIRDGFRVHVGTPWSEADLLTMVRTEWFDLIGFSAGCESRLSVLKREIHRIRSNSRNPNVQVLVGGQVFSLDPALVERVGADGWARDARESPVVARTLCGRVRPAPASQSLHAGAPSALPTTLSAVADHSQPS